MEMNRSYNKFTQIDYDSIIEQFKNHSDEKFKKFHESLVPGIKTTYGVRVPQIRAIAKEILKSDPQGFLDLCQDTTFEEIQLHGFVISGLKVPLSEKLHLVAEFIPLIDNWAVCDTFSFKVKENEKSLLWDFTQAYFDSDKTYDIRYAVVTGLSNFITDVHIDSYIERLASITHEDYYVKMAVAWAVCDCFIKQREKTEKLLSEKRLDPWTQNKAIQKCRESRRVSSEDKEYLLSLKI
ncbi:MAG: DNA alkylation repair protein [Clostridioides sp.]|jgi:3-methyladenine DNA glycosylase AlkD|nr:DNA alkylation repair protein [Clostridioides sp.]